MVRALSNVIEPEQGGAVVELAVAVAIVIAPVTVSEAVATEGSSAAAYITKIE